MSPAEKNTRQLQSTPDPKSGFPCYEQIILQTRMVKADSRLLEPTSKRTGHLSRKHKVAFTTPRKAAPEDASDGNRTKSRAKVREGVKG